MDINHNEIQSIKKIFLNYLLNKIGHLKSYSGQHLGLFVIILVSAPVPKLGLSLVPTLELEPG